MQVTKRKEDRFQGDNLALSQIASLIKSCSGINLTEEKFILIETRLRARLGELGLRTFSEYFKILHNDEKEIQACVEYLTTHKTSWFREIVHFQWLKKRLEDRVSSTQRFNIWSAACSRGPEVYSLMLLCLRENLNYSQFCILGTDISSKILFEAENLAHSMETRSQIDLAFRDMKNNPNLVHEIESALEHSVKFRQLNIVKNTLSSAIQFDVVFLRNVLIYFDKETIIKSCRNLGKNLKPGGHLVIGVTESLPKELKEYRSIGDSIYVYEPELKRAS